MNHSIFALELCLRLEPGSRLRDELHQLVMSHPATTTPGRKWELLRSVAELLAENEDLFEMGCWDFFDTDAKALSGSAGSTTKRRLKSATKCSSKYLLAAA